MAVFPCSWTPHRYPQPQQSIYFTQVFENLADTRCSRLCPRHFDETLMLIRQFMSDVEDMPTTDKTCDQCGDEATGTLYAKIFALKSEPMYYASDLCTKHFTAVGHELHVSNGRPMTGR